MREPNSYRLVVILNSFGLKMYGFETAKSYFQMY